jgi:hypothetical protein
MCEFIWCDSVEVNDRMHDLDTVFAELETEIAAPIPDARPAQC